jgi:proteic killer suppression protein
MQRTALRAAADAARMRTFFIRIDKRHVTDYYWRMIKTFADRHTQEMYDTGKSKRFPPDIWKRAIRKLEYIDLATRLEDLKIPPSNRLHELERERKDQFSISVNDQWRICFRFIDGDAYDVELTDYH